MPHVFSRTRLSVWRGQLWRIEVCLLILGLAGILSGMPPRPAAASDSEADGKWREHKENHFIIYYKSAPEDLVVNVADTAENCYREIAHNLGFSRYNSWSWENRAKIYIYDSQEDYVNSSRQAGWSAGEASTREKVIRTFPSAAGFFDSVLPHEMGHIIFREFIGARADVPLWLEEGVAMYQEKAKRWGADEFVRHAIAEKQFLPLPELSQMKLSSASSNREVNLFYAEAASAFQFLFKEGGDRHFVEFCEELQKNDKFAETFRRVYGRFETLERLNQKWLEYLKKGN
ncbi:MAG: hypothetical protein HQL23_04140 [Candidatus Omnitrophica bacterium]|nr:hypothetical protein [Candidatus Omnitrophota bacterium]